MNNELVHLRMFRALILVGPIATLAVSPVSNFDPINLIKILFISTFSFFCFGILISTFNYSFNKLSNFFWLACAAFTLSLISTLVFSGAPRAQQFWGSFGRNTGFLAYFSFLIILVASAVIQNRVFYTSLIKSLVFTSIPIAIYCLIQMAGLDPVRWSAYDTFATLGNVNFLSAFLGMAALAAITISLDKKLSKTLRMALLILSLVSLVIIISTNSIQGPLIFAAGLGISVLLYLRSSEKLRMLTIPFSLLGVTGFALSLAGLFNKGPLASVIFQPSVIYRADYMHAGWKMTVDHPFFGVGLDSFGDWYRQSRGLLSTVRTGPDRTANTAHNIFLDISSNGGLPLIISYLCLLTFAFFGAIKYLRSNKQFDPYFVAIFSVWCAYQIQACVSINQVGVGVWGWLFTGALIGYRKTSPISSASNAIKLKTKRKKTTNVLPASVGLSVGVTTICGIILAFIPLNADRIYMSASNARDLNRMMSASKLLGATPWHLSQVIQSAMTNNYLAQATEINNLLLKDYPRDFYGWKVKYYISTSTPAEKTNALAELHQLDPFNPDVPKS